MPGGTFIVPCTPQGAPLPSHWSPLELGLWWQGGLGGKSGSVSTNPSTLSGNIIRLLSCPVNNVLVSLSLNMENGIATLVPPQWHVTRAGSKSDMVVRTCDLSICWRRVPSATQRWLLSAGLSVFPGRPFLSLCPRS